MAEERYYKRGRLAMHVKYLWDTATHISYDSDENPTHVTFKQGDMFTATYSKKFFEVHPELFKYWKAFGVKRVILNLERKYKNGLLDLARYKEDNRKNKNKLSKNDLIMAKAYKGMIEEVPFLNCGDHFVIGDPAGSTLKLYNGSLKHLGLYNYINYVQTKKTLDEDIHMLRTKKWELEDIFEDKSGKVKEEAVEEPQEEQLEEIEEAEEEVDAEEEVEEEGA